MQVLFFCHFPDYLLVQNRNCIKKVYRIPFDALEQATTGASDSDSLLLQLMNRLRFRCAGMADRVLVNSHFTAGEFRSAFRCLSRVPLTVLHPSINLEQYDSREQKLAKSAADDDGTQAVRCAARSCINSPLLIPHFACITVFHSF